MEDHKIPLKLSGNLLEELGNDFLPGDKLNKNDLYNFMNGDFASKIVNVIFEINEIHSEICRIINETKVIDELYIQRITLEDLKFNVKAYYTYWSTLRDFIASVINNIFDLGIDDKDVSWNLIFRNKHVINSSLPKIIVVYSKLLKPDYMSKMRNDIVHRGVLNDSEVMDLVYKKNKLFSDKYSLLSESQISDEDYAEKNIALEKEIFELSHKKHTEIKEHYMNTIKMINEIMIVLAKEVKKNNPTIYMIS